MGAAKFKEQCLAVLSSLDAEGLVITKHGKPIAKVVPIPREPQDLIGSLRGKIQVRGDLLSTGVRWRLNAKP
jgi:antitoxin (DNA-binding transcriptional repressor) of toxin-antitoxin stability system